MSEASPTSALSLHLKQAVRVLRAGGIVLHATEGVWGLACDPLQPEAVLRLLTLKDRQAEQGLILIGARAEMFAPELAALSGAERRAILDSWPGAVTWLLPSRRFPDWITGGRDTVALRVPGHQQARELAAAFGAPLVSTSANVSGRPPARNRFQARAFFSRNRAVDFLLPGETGGRSTPSKIRTLDGQVVRGG